MTSKRQRRWSSFVTDVTDRRGRRGRPYARQTVVWYDHDMKGTPAEYEAEVCSYPESTMPTHIAMATLRITFSSMAVAR